MAVEHLKSDITPNKNPSFGNDVLFYILGGGLLLLVLNMRALWNLFNKGSSEAPQTANVIFSQKGKEIGDMLGGLFQGKLVSVVLWALIGCLVYIIIWVIQNFFINIKNDFAANQYVHPSSYSSTKYWSSVLAYKIFLAASIVMFIIYCILSLRLFLPLSSKVFFSSVYDFKLARSKFDLLGSIIAAAIILYIFVLLLRVVSHSARWITTNL